MASSTNKRHSHADFRLKDVPSPPTIRSISPFQYTSVRTELAMPPDDQIFSSSAVRYQLSVDRDDMLAPDISRVLVIYTGGTIGMKNTKQHGYVPAPNFLAKTLASMARFHDPEDTGMFRSQSTKEPELLPLYPDLDDQASPSESPTVNKVRLTEEMLKYLNLGMDEDGAQKGKTGVSQEAKSEGETDEDGVHVKQVPSLITPISLYGKRIRYSILEYDPLLDSCNMTMSDWVRIATDIEANYQFYDAFIILHGTDTMAYTASALSFMLEELGKTVILTGSQVPITEIRNDAVENVLGALTIAGHFVIPEVCLYFGQRLFRGNRTSKLNAMDFDAFESPNLRPLVTVGINIDVAWSEVLRPTQIAKFRAHKQMNPNVATLRLFPGITESTIRAFLAPPIQGIVLETYGAGNAPSTRQDLIAALEDANARGVVIINCTQCKKGLVTDVYATGKVLSKVGVIPGADMTPECALTKLSYLLSKGYNNEQIRALITSNLRGELTVLAPRQRFTFYNRTHTLIQTIITAASSNLKHEANDIGTSDVVGMSTSLQERILVEKTLYPILLCSAASTNDMEGLLLLYENLGDSLNLNCIDYDGRTPLHLACSEGHTAIVEFLLLHGASVHARDRFGHTPLFDAVREGHLEIVRLLRETGGHFAESEIEDAGWSWLRAVRDGGVSQVQLMIEAGWDVNWRGGFDERRAIHLAVAEGRVGVLEVLLSSEGTDLEARDRWGRRAQDELEGMLVGLERGGKKAEVRAQIGGERMRVPPKEMVEEMSRMIQEKIKKKRRSSA